jgi:predicted TIM-barrel fold metal-dependent hydrolase
MDKTGIEKAIIFLSEPGSYFGDEELAKQLSRLVNEECKKTVVNYPGKFGAFGILPIPYTEAALREIEYIFDTLKLDGVALLSNVAGVYPGDESMDEIFAELNKRKAIVMVHPTTPLPEQISKLKIPGFMLEFPFETTRAVVSLLLRGTAEKYRDIRFLFAHAGGTMPYLAQRFEYMRTRGFFQEIEQATPRGANASLQDFYYDTALSYGDATLELLDKFVGVDHILFGSDWPFAPDRYMQEGVVAIRNHFSVNKRIRDAIEHENAVRLLNTSNRG